MKKVLVTGASGAIGLKVIKYLLSEGKYEITALDLKNKKVLKRLKKYQKRINIIYGDVNDENLITALVKSHDYIIHLASVLPPFGELAPYIGNIVDYEGTNNIINAIKRVNQKCYLLYASTTSIYDKSLGASALETIKESELTNYSYYKYKTEELIKDNLTNYTILRVPLVLSDLKNETFIYNVKKDLYIELTTTNDAAYAFVKALNYIKELKGKTYNIGMGVKGRLQYREVLNNILRNYGLSFKYILTRTFLKNNYISPILTDSDDLEALIHYRHDSTVKYYQRLKNKSKNRILAKIMGRIYLFMIRG